MDKRSYLNISLSALGKFDEPFPDSFFRLIVELIGRLIDFISSSQTLSEHADVVLHVKKPHCHTRQRELLLISQ